MGFLTGTRLERNLEDFRAFLSNPVANELA